MHPVTRYHHELAAARAALPPLARQVEELHDQRMGLSLIAERLELPLSEIQSAWAQVKEVHQIRPTPEAPELLEQWSPQTVELTAGPAWRRYERELQAHYIDYYAGREDERDPRQKWSARTPADALPPSPHREQLLSNMGKPHKDFRSAKSSQALVLALLGAACLEDPALGWLWQQVGVAESGSVRRWQVEYEMERELLGESVGTPTSVDLLAECDAAVVCLEAKWREGGMGFCSCGKRGEGDPEIGACSGRVLARDRYWAAGSTVFGLPAEPQPQEPCPIAAGYQAVRNAAAALEMARDGRQAIFVLLYSADNPAFAGSEETQPWPGWIRVLEASIARSQPPENFSFVPLSWQELVSELPLDEATRAWARAKHGLE